MKEQDMISWLMQTGGPVIRYRTAAELCGQIGYDMEQLERDLLNDSNVKKALNLFEECTVNSNLWNWHGSKKELLENVLGKLLEFGFNKNIGVFDEKIATFYSWLDSKPPQSPDHTPISSIFIAWCLLRSGYNFDELIKYMLKRIDYIYASAKEQIFDIYLNGKDLKGISKKFINECIKPELNPYSGSKPLPLIHDIYALAFYPKDLVNDEIKERINRIIDYILNDSFQRIREGYGYLVLNNKNYCHSCGWSPTFPGYNGFDLEGMEQNKFFMRVELMSHFVIAHNTKWFLNSIEHLEQFCTPEGTYLLPSAYLCEKASGYYVLGAYMGLENKRTSKSLELESTFRMMCIKKRMENKANSDCII